MSQENVELVRAIYQAVERRDWDRAFRDQHPDVELTTPPGIDAGTYRGRAEIQRFWEDWFAVFEERSSANPEQFIESGDTVAVVLKIRAWPKGSTAAIEIRNGHLWSIREGKVVSMRMFPNPEDALEAAGVREQAMSQQNVEVVRQMLQAFADGGLDAMAEFWDPDIDWRAAEGAIDDVGEMHGSVAVRRYIQDWIDTFDGFSVVVEELRDVGDDRVLAIQRLNGRAKLSGTETDLRYAVVNTVRDGKVVRGREYLSVEDALEAVGLRE